MALTATAGPEDALTTGHQPDGGEPSADRTWTGHRARPLSPHGSLGQWLCVYHIIYWLAITVLTAGHLFFTFLLHVGLMCGCWQLFLTPR